MVKQMTPEKVIYFVWLSVALSFCWPVTFTSNRKRVNVYKVLQVISVVNACLMLLPLLYSVYLHFDDVISVCKSISVGLCMSQAIVQCTICSITHDSLQRVVEDMVTCVKEAKQYEREIFCKYIVNYHRFYGCCITLVYATAIVFMLGPAVLPITFPFDMEYPFPVNNTLVYAMLYFHQIISTYQCTAHMCVSGFGALLLWFTAARFECLAVEFQESSNVDTMIVCIKKQLRLKRYAEELVSIFRFVALYAIAVSTGAMILCSFILIMNPPVLVKMQFVAALCTVLTEVYMYAWPADYMKDMSVNVSRSVYELSWYEQALGMQKHLLNVLMYQSPVTLSISCVMPELSLRYFCSYLSNAFSIFTAVRVMLESDES